jgi:hypothetical protein
MEKSNSKTAADRIRASTFHSDGGLSGIIGYVAQPGWGKTYLMGKAITGTRRCVVFNSVGSFQGHVAPRKNKLAGFTFVSNIPSFVRAIRGGNRSGSFRICYTPVEGDEQIEFEAVSKLVWFAENCVFAIDEVWLYQRPTKSPFYLRKMMLTGRHHGITLLWTAQRPALTDATLRSVSDQLYLGGFGSRLDVDAFKGTLADDALEKLPSLPLRTFVHRDEMRQWRLYKSR